MDPPLSGPALTAATAKLKPRGKLCWSLDYIGIHRICTIKLLQTGRDSFTVQYGFQVKPHLTYSSAAHELGACIMHALACESLLDNRTPGER